MLGLVFAGSPTKIAGGVRIDGIDVGGLEATAARALLEHKAGALAGLPIVFVAAGHRFAVRPNELGVESDWKAAVDSAQRQGDGFGPLRGFKRLDVDFFGADVTPPTTVLTGALQYELNRIEKKVDRLPVDAAVVRRGLAIVVLPARTGVRLDRTAAAQTIVERLSSLERSSEPVQLPLRTTQPRVRAAALAAVAAQARLALSAPVRLRLGPTRWLVRPKRLAELLELPSGGETALRIGGPAAESWLKQLAANVETPPRNATWAVSGPHVRLVPAKPGLQLDAVGSAQAVLHAALRRRVRVAQLVVEEEPAKLTTAQASRMGIDALVSSYTTIYGGIPNRIHNVQLVAHLVNDKLIAPGETFSFNKTTGARNAAKGFLEAPVIVNGELTTGLGGGVCQVSTTVFNAAFDAGIPITDAYESRALHQPLPAGTRRDGRLPRRRPEVRQRHEALAAAADVRGPLVAHRQPVRHADGAQGREHDEPARRARQDAGEEDGRSDAQARGAGDRRSRRAPAVDERHP